VEKHDLMVTKRRVPGKDKSKAHKETVREVLQQEGTRFEKHVLVRASTNSQGERENWKRVGEG